MYLKFSIESGTISSFVAGSKFKRDFLKYWPTKYVDGIRVMSELTMYQGGVTNNLANQKIYKLLGTSVAEVGSNNYNGVERAWMYFKRFDIPVDPLSTGEVSSTISSMPGDTVTVACDFIFTENTYTYDRNINQANELKTTEEILLELEQALATGQYDRFIYDVNSIPYLFLVLLDTANEMFDIEYSGLTKKSISVPVETTFGSSSSISNKVVSALQVKIKFTKKETPIVTQVYVDKLNSIPMSIMPIRKDYERLADSFTTYTETDLYYSQGVSDFSNSSERHYVKYDGIKSLKLDEFRKFVGKSLDTDYRQEESEWWEKLVAIVLVIIIIVVAIFTQQYWLANVANATLLGSVAAATTVLTVGTLAMAGLAGVLQRMGNYGFSYAIGKATVVLQKISEIIGWATLIAGIKNIMVNGFVKEMTAEAAKQAGREAIKTVGNNVVVKMTISEIAMQVMSWMSTGFGEWQKYQAKDTSKGINEMQQKIAEQEEAINDLPTPKKYALEKYMFESYTFLEINELMDDYVDNSVDVDKYTRKYF